MNGSRMLHDDPSPAADLNAEKAILASVYRFVLDCHVKRKAAEVSGGENDGRGVKDAPARRSIP